MYSQNAANAISRNQIFRGEDAPDPPTIFHKVSATELWLATDWTAIFIPF
jgi:hypothetical protein